MGNGIKMFGLCVIIWGRVSIAAEFWQFPWRGEPRFYDNLVEERGLEIKYLKKDYALTNVIYNDLIPLVKNAEFAIL